tara:strand:+ start:220 stop:927 length:708 start_codon:yes stop_codon:yes gene_type:complete
MKKLEDLADLLGKMGLSDEAYLIRKIASERVKYKVKPGDTLSGIAKKFGFSVKDIQAENGMKEEDTAIRAGQILKIPRAAASATDIVAMTLLGEGGTLKGVGIMKEVMTVIKNRAECRSMTLDQVVLEKNQFSCWIGKDPDTVFYSDMGKKHKLWDSAYKIAKNIEIDSNVGKSTHYYVHKTDQVSKSKRNYEEKPSWADKANPKANWEEVYKGSHHTYGIDRSVSHYRKCTASS